MCNNYVRLKGTTVSGNRLERSSSKVNSLTLTRLKYYSYIQKVKNLKTTSKKESNDLRFLRRYDIIEVNGITKLIHPVTDQENITYYVFNEEIFGVLNKAHIFTGHGGRDRTIQKLRGKFQNVTTEDILLFLSLCEPGVQKLKHKKRTGCKAFVIQRNEFTISSGFD